MNIQPCGMRHTALPKIIPLTALPRECYDLVVLLPILYVIRELNELITVS